MPGWNPALSTAPSGWGTASTDEWRNWKPICTKVTGRKHIIPKRPDAALLMDYGPTNRPKIENGTLFDLLPMDIIN